MGKYDNLFPEMTQAEMARAREVIHNNQNSDTVKGEQFYTWVANGVDPFEVYFVGPFTAKYYLRQIGISVDYIKNMEEKRSILCGFAASNAVFNLECTNDFNEKTKKNEINVKIAKNTFDRELHLMSPQGDDVLTFWDKFCQFFGWKTKHVHDLEMDRMGIEVCREKYRELSKNLTLQKNSEKLSNLKQKLETKLNGVSRVAKLTNKRITSWDNVLFDKDICPNKVYDYTTSKGKTISPRSLCLMALQQRTGMDFSAITPEEFSEQMNNDEKLKETVKEVVKSISDITSKNNIAVNLPQFKYLDQFLFEDNKDLQALDSKLRAIIKPTKDGPAFKMSIAKNFNKATRGAEKESLFAAGTVMIKAREDMLKLFGKHDETFGNLDKNDLPKDYDMHEMEATVKETMKVVRAKQYLQEEKYEDLLKLYGRKYEFKKLGDIFDIVDKQIDDVNKTLTYGSMSEYDINALKNSDKDIPNMENDEPDMNM